MVWPGMSNGTLPLKGQNRLHIIWNDHRWSMICGSDLESFWPWPEGFNITSTDYRQMMVISDCEEPVLASKWQCSIWHTWSNHDSDMVRWWSYCGHFSSCLLNSEMTAIWPYLEHGLTRYIKCNLAISRSNYVCKNLIWPWFVYDLEGMF